MMMSSSSVDGAGGTQAAPATAVSVSGQVPVSSSSKALLPPNVSNKIVNTLDPCVVLMKRMVQEHSDKWNDRGGIFALSQGVVYWTPPQESLLDMQTALLAENSNLHMYGPDEGLAELRDALEAKIARENRLTNHDVMVTVGANQAYVNCVLTLLNGDVRPSTQETAAGSGNDASTQPAIERAVVFAPYYFNHVMAIQMCSPESLLVGPCSDDGVPDADWLEQQFRSGQKIQMVTVVNPGNPTGVTLDRSILQRVVDLCRTHACWLILDCTYENFVHTPGTAERRVNGNSGSESGPTFDGCFDDEPHVIHIFSFSKSYALAGYRCGYLALHRGAAGLYENMLKVQDTVPIAPSRISQVAALGALRAGESWVAERVATLAAGREAILHALQPLKVMGGTGAMYVMAQLPESYRNRDQIVARDLVRDYGVAVIPGSFCGFPGWIRVCYSNLPPDLCLQGKDALHDCFLFFRLAVSSLTRVIFLLPIAAADRLSKGIQSLISDASQETT
jgi:aromatic aminotransferase